MADKFDNKLDKVLTDWAKKVCEAYKYKISQLRASGELHDTASYGVKNDANSKIAYLLLADYWKYIEEGRMPGTFPPVDEIRQWIRQKPIIPQPIQLPNGRNVIPTENQLAFLIGRSIMENGIPAKPYLNETIQEYDFGLLTAIGKVLKDEVIATLEIDFKNR